MATITIQEAQSRLPNHSRLNTRRRGGDYRAQPAGGSAAPAPAIRVRPPRPRPPVTGTPRAGTVPGLVVPDDFKAPLEELREYME